MAHLLLAVLLFATGLAGALARRNTILVLVGIDLKRLFCADQRQRIFMPVVKGKRDLPEIAVVRIGFIKQNLK